MLHSWEVLSERNATLNSSHTKASSEKNSMYVAAASDPRNTLTTVFVCGLVGTEFCK